MSTYQYGVAELTLHSSRDYANPLWDCELVGRFTSPSGRRLAVRGF